MARPPAKTDMDEHPDAWKRFERAVDIAMKTPPMHREGKAKGKTKAVKPKRNLKKQ